MSWIEAIYVPHKVEIPVRGVTLHYDALDTEPRFGPVYDSAKEAIKSDNLRETVIYHVPPWLLSSDYTGLNRSLLTGACRCILGSDDLAQARRLPNEYNIRATMLSPKLWPVYGDVVVWFESHEGSDRPLCISSTEIRGEINDDRTEIAVNNFLRHLVVQSFTRFTSVKACREFFTERYNGT